MKIAIAQIPSLPGNIDANTQRHRQCIESAATQGVDAIFFPELSLTGYEPTLAARLAMTPNDARLEVFRQISDRHAMTIGLGLPIKCDTLPEIGFLIFCSGSDRLLYTKQYLHPDEMPYFSAGRNTFTHITGARSIALAICYEIAVPAHLEAIRQYETSCYLASVAKFQSGIDAAHERLAFIAGQLQVPVLMANAVGEADGGRCAGRSAVWDKNGRMIRQLNETEEGLLVYDTVSGTARKSSLAEG